MNPKHHAFPRARRLGLAALVLLPVLAGCEQLGFDSPEKIEAYKEAEGKAIGAGCRQTGRAIEDCYSMNTKSSKAAIFAGWREMDEYMRENNLSVVATADAASAPDVPPPAATASKPAVEAQAAASKASGGDKPSKVARKGPSKPSEADDS